MSLRKEDLFQQLSDRDLCVLTLYGEGRGEPIEGQIAIMNVIKNRRLETGKDYKEIVIKPLQFSCWNDNDPNLSILLEMGEKILNNQPLNGPLLTQIEYIVDGVMTFKIMDNTQGSNHYLTTALYRSKDRPNWAKATNIMIGKHTFLWAA